MDVHGWAYLMTEIALWLYFLLGIIWIFVPPRRAMNGINLIMCALLGFSTLYFSSKELARCQGAAVYMSPEAPVGSRTVPCNPGEACSLGDLAPGESVIIQMDLGKKKDKTL